MNKQKAIEKIEKLKGLTIKEKNLILDIEMIPKGDVLEIIEQIDEPEKPVVPQFVADFYESIKDDFEDGVYDLCVQFNNGNDELSWWFAGGKNKPIETLVKMKLYGYEVEKEKLYEVFLKRTGAQLGVCVPHGEDKTQFTKVELQEYGFDNLDVYEVEEVE